jgi:phospholipid transport system substrate-binding protein
MRTLAALLAVLLTAAAGAQPPASSSAPTRAPLDEPYHVASPDQIIRQGVDRLAGFLIGSGGASPQAVREFVEIEIAPYFDFRYMARWAAGPLFTRLTPEQRVALQAQLRTMFLDALARNLGSLETPLPRIDVFPARPGSSVSQAHVYAHVFASQRPALRLEFRFYWSDDGWKVYDAVANGASAAAFYRSYYTRMLRRHGPEVVLR